MSILSSHGTPSITSGARYQRDCTYELRVSKSHTAEPKSMILTRRRLAETRHTFSGWRTSVREMMESMLPGSDIMVPKFELTFVELELMKPNKVGQHAVVTPYPANHTAKTHPTSLRVEAGGKIVSYTGDTAWTKHVPKISKDADLFICESYFYEKPVRFHMNYPDVKEHWDEFEAKRTILTHMSPEMLAMADSVPEECAHDGLVVEI